MEFRNIAIIAHVDHGKTTLVDALLSQSGTFKAHQEVETRVMDSFEQEKERGITIYAKNTSLIYNDCKINVVDTPGHADFGSEVERALRMVDSVLLVVDAYEGPMPQTKFVLTKALEQGLKPIVVINKVDKPSSRCDWVVDQLFDLFVKLGADDDQLDFPICYAIAREGKAGVEPDQLNDDIFPLLDMVIDQVKPADVDKTVPFRMQVTNLAYDNFLGRMAVGRVTEGEIKRNQDVYLMNETGTSKRCKISEVLVTEGLHRIKVPVATSGDIITLAGIDDVYVGDTITTNEKSEPLPAIKIDEPTLKMVFMVNSSPFAGQEGSLLTSRQIRDRLEKEMEVNVGMKMDLSNPEEFMVCGRGELHLSVLVETMRREGFELQVGAPQVIYKEENGKRLEPIEQVTISTPSEFSGSVIAELGRRKGEMKNLLEENDVTFLEYAVPSRGLLGFRSEFTTLTKGEGILSSVFEAYQPYKGAIERRQVGNMISAENGSTMAFSLWNLQERGPLFIDPAVPIYEGMIIGEHLKGSDLTVNPTKNKKLTNVRASGKDDALNLIPPRRMNLEEAIDYIGEDEYVEVTPTQVRLRKKLLKESDRKRAKR